MSGLVKLAERIATIRWAADWMEDHGTGTPEQDLRGLAATLESALDMVRQDYAADDSDDAAAAPDDAGEWVPEPVTAETRQLAAAALDAADDDDDDAEPEARSRHEH